MEGSSRTSPIGAKLDMVRFGRASRSKTAVLAGLVVFLGIAPVAGWGHGAVSDELISLAMALGARAFPGARVENDTVVWPDGRRERYELSPGGLGDVGGEVLMVAGLEFPDRRDAVVAKLDRSVHVPDASAGCRIVMLRATRVAPGSMPTVLGYREVSPDIASPLTTCGGVALDTTGGSVPPASGSRWPRLLVAYTSFHPRTGGALAISWNAVVDGETRTWLSRIPITVTRARQDTWEDITARQDSPDAVLFTGSSGRTFRVRCQLTTCLVTPDIVRQIFP